MAEFQSDRNARDCSDQFLWGKGFMIAPILDDNTNSRGVYFPGNKWYNYYTNEAIDGETWQVIETDESTIPLFVRDGTILIEQEPELTTTAQANNDMKMKVYASSESSGSLFWDDGQSRLDKNENLYIKYELTRNGSSGSLSATCSDNCITQTVNLAEIQFIGAQLLSATLNGEELPVSDSIISLDNVVISDNWMINLTFVQ